MTVVRLKMPRGEHSIYAPNAGDNLIGQRVPLSLFGDAAGSGVVVSAAVKDGELEVGVDVGDASPDVLIALGVRA